jgi:prepilin-type N-terminal cleavage/methylation domain-containing protein
MMRARRGFTLWEMSIVLAITALVAAVVIPAMVGPQFGNDPVPQVGDQIVGLLRDARRAAIDYDQTITVRVDPTSGFYQVDTTGAYGTGVYSQGQLDLSAYESLVTDLPRLVYVFRPTGAAFGDSVGVRGANGAATVFVDPWSGMPYADPR